MVWALPLQVYQETRTLTSSWVFWSRFLDTFSASWSWTAGEEDPYCLFVRLDTTYKSIYAKKVSTGIVRSCLYHLWTVTRSHWSHVTGASGTQTLGWIDFRIVHIFSLDFLVSNWKVRGQCMFCHRLCLHSGDVPHSDQEPGGGNMLPGGQDWRNCQSASGSAQGDQKILRS